MSIGVTLSHVKVMESQDGNIEDQLPCLVDPFVEEVGEIKLEIHRVKNRIGVIKSFYHHMRTSKTAVVRRELSEKVFAESDIIEASIAKIADSLYRWKQNPDLVGERRDLETSVTQYLKEVLAEYQQVLDDQREYALKHIQEQLRVTTTTENIQIENGGGAYSLVNQAHLKAISEQNHIEIEEQYTDLLKTDRILRRLQLKFAHLLTSKEYTDLAVLQLSKLMAQRNDTVYQPTASSRKKAFLLAGITSVGVFILIGLMFLV